MTLPRARAVPPDAGTVVAPPRAALPAAVGVIVASSAVYLAGSAVAPALAAEWALSPSEASAITSAGQAGFILGTLATALLNLPDRIRPGLLAAMLLLGAAAANGLGVIAGGNLAFALTLRFLAGALAGPVYPLAMKVLATWYPRLGWELGILLGFSTLGYGSAFLLRALHVPWQGALLATSALAVAGALLALAALRPGPRLPAASPFSPGAAWRAFREPAYRRSAFAYFGHMWELVAFWALLPFWLVAAGLGEGAAMAVAGGVFVTGAAACVLAGAASRRHGEARVAMVALLTSGTLCAVSPLLFGAPPWLLAAAALLWGAAVIADSAMYSALSARTAPQAYVGTALTTQNSLGFALTLVTLALVPLVVEGTGTWRYAFLVLAMGPLLGLLPLRALLRADPAGSGGIGSPGDKKP